MHVRLTNDYVYDGGQALDGPVRHLLVTPFATPLLAKLGVKQTLTFKAEVLYVRGVVKDRIDAITLLPSGRFRQSDTETPLPFRAAQAGHQERPGRASRTPNRAQKRNQQDRHDIIFKVPFVSLLKHLMPDATISALFFNDRISYSQQIRTDQQPEYWTLGRSMATNDTGDKPSTTL